MPWSALKQTTAPATQPVTLDEAKQHLRVDHNDEDTLIRSLIGAAVASIDGPNGVGIAMVAQSYQMALDCFPTCIYLPVTPVLSVEAVNYVDADGAPQTMDAADYQVDTINNPARLMPAYGTSWPVTRAALNAVTVDFTVGYTNVPDDLKAAVLLTVGHLYENRESVVVGVTASTLPMGVESIVERYRVGRVA